MRQKSHSHRSYPHTTKSHQSSQSHQSVKASQVAKSHQSSQSPQVAETHQQKEISVKISHHKSSHCSTKDSSVNLSQTPSTNLSQDLFVNSSQSSSAGSLQTSFVNPSQGSTCFDPLFAEVDIERFADQGRAIAHLDGRVLFIRFALPGEKVRVSIDIPHRKSASFWSGEVTEILENKSPLRITPPYRLFGPLAEGGGLGGANLCFVNIQGQHEWKKFIIDSQMERLGKTITDVEVIGCEYPPEVKENISEIMAKDTTNFHAMLPVVDNNIPEIMAFGWRTRVDLIANKEGYPSMLKRASHVHVPLEDLPLASRGVAFIARHFHIWDGGFKPGTRIHIAVPQMRGYEDLSDEEYGKKILESSNFSIFVDDKLIEGKADIEEIVPLYWDGVRNENSYENGSVQELRFSVSGNGFWQIHRHAPIYLVSEVLRLLQHIQIDPYFSAGDLLKRGMWDLYSGSGLFTAVLAMWARRVYSGLPHTSTKEKDPSLWSGEGLIGIEGFPAAVLHTRKNMKNFSLEKVHCYEGDVGKTIHRLPMALKNPYVVILDPPRAGAKREVCQQIIQAGAQYVIYIACNPTSLARDAATFIEGGYKLESIRAFDIYPMTHHVETIALFIKGK